MQTIWKYPLAIKNQQTLPLPQGSKFMCVQVQNNVPCIWALVDDKAQPGTRSVLMFGTGHPAGPAEVDAYIGTFQLQRGALVFHVFEE